MDPRFQQQNNSPYPQTNPYSQSGPSKYPTLPPVNNPQSPNYPAPHQQYPQQPYTNPQSNPNTGYIPPTGYTHLPILSTYEAESESLLLSDKLKELEKGFDTCFMKCYQTWLWVIIIVSSMTVFKTSILLMTGFRNIQDKNLNVIGFFYGTWTLIQSVFAVLAYRQKSLVKATLACIMMCLNLIPNLYADIYLSIEIKNYVPDPKDDSYHLWYGIMYSLVFLISLHTLVHIFVDLVGAFRVRRILSERVQVLAQLKRNDDSFLSQ